MKFQSTRPARKNVIKTFSIAVAAALAVSGITIAAAPAGPARADTAPVSASDQEWTDLQAQLAGIEGTWTDQTYTNALTTGMPDTALLGNGDVGVVSGGGTGYKSFYVTKGDFWSGNGGVSPAGLGSVSIKPVTPATTGPVDLALGATATASNYYQSFTPDRAVNGQWGSGYEGWVTNVGKPQWLALDLGSVKDISRYVIKFDSAARPGNDANTGKDFILQTSVDGTTWTNLDTTTGNTAATFDKTLPTFSTRYIRIYLNTPTQESTSDSINNPRARIGAFQLFAPVPNVNVALGATATASNYYQSFTPDRAVNGQWGPGYEGWVTNVGKPQWLALDLGSVKDISRYVIKFDSAARPGNDANTGKDFVLQTSVDGTNWTARDTITGNSAAIFDKTLPTFSTRYIRIYLNTPTQETTSDSINNPRARIGAFELYGSASAATPPPPATTFLEKENILDAKVDTDVNIGGADLTMHTWVAANDNIVVTQLTSDADKAVDLQLQTWAGAGSAKAGTVSTAGVDGSTLWATRSTSPNGTGWVSRAALATRLLGATLSNTGATGPTASGQFTLQPGQTVQIVTGVGGGGQNTTGHLEQAEALASGVDAAKVDALDAEHAAWWKKYWLQSHVSLSDPTLEKYYYSALYFMGSASRAGKQAPGIFGIWPTQDNQQWSGDYHLNYNAQAPFYGVYSANRPELALPFYDTILDYVPNAQKRAQNDLARLFPSNIGIASRPDLSNGIEDGVLFPVGIGPWGSTTDDNYHHQTLDSLFNATQFISYYDYTGDTDYLANEAYPYLVKTANFFEQYLQFDSSTNLYYMWSAHHEGTWAKDSSPDIGMLKYLLSSLIDESTTLGVDADKRVTWQHILDHLPAAPTTVYNGKTVYALADPGTTTVPTDDGAGTDNRDIRPGDQPVNLEFVAPGNQIGINSPADQRQIAIDTLTAMNSWGQDNAFPKVFTIAARVGWPAQDLINRLDGQITAHMGPNMRIVSSQHGIEKNGAIEAIDSMLLQTSEGVTDVFPDWPTAKNASFTRLRTDGAFTLSAALTNSVVGPISITSDKGNALKLKNPWSTSNISVTKGGHAVDYTLANGVISFDTTAGADYVVALVTAPTAVSAPTISGSATVGESLTATAGEWNVGGLDFHYQWQRNGVDIDGATDSTYEIQAADYGARLTVTVTASRTGFGSGSSSSNPVGPVTETEPPTVKVAISPDAGSSGWRNTATVATVTAADDISGVGSIEYRLNGGAWTAYTAPVALADGTTTFDARATDVAGNVSDVGSATAKVDTTAPVTQATLDDAARTVTLSAQDVTSGVARTEYTVGAASGWTQYTGSPILIGGAATTVWYRSVDVAGNVEDTRTVNVAALADGATSKPGQGALSNDNGWDTGLQDGDYNVVMNLWWGQEGSLYRLYENGNLIATRQLTNGGVGAQSVSIPVSGRKNGTYVYSAELIDSKGTTATTSTTVKVTQANPGEPVLSNDNWSGGGTFTVTANLWWGTNATSYTFYENGVAVGQGNLVASTPNAQSATLKVTAKAKGTYVYRVDFTNAAGTTSSKTMTVTVTK